MFENFSRSLRGNVDRNLSMTENSVESILVVPYVGTWIEMVIRMIIHRRLRVVPYVGTWIEIVTSFGRSITALVVPYVGTWIEILGSARLFCAAGSFPTWERG